MRLAISRPGLTLVEVLIVLFIIAGLLGLLLPAVQQARSSSRRMTCQSNIRQQSIALTELWRSSKDLPPPVRPGFSGGWTVAILPFMEERTLEEQLQQNPALNSASFPLAALSRPAIMTCPSAPEIPSTVPPVMSAHHVIATGWNRETWDMGDAPVGFSTPWCAGPEIMYDIWETSRGPHEGGFNVTQSDGSVRFRMPANPRSD